MFPIIHTISEVTYYIIFLICIISAFKADEKSIPGCVYLKIMLCAGLITEIAVIVAKKSGLNDVLPYYLYIPIEYCMLILFYVANTNKKYLRIALLSSICVFLGIALVIIMFNSANLKYPDNLYNTSCLLNIISLSILFFDLDVREDEKLLSIPVFWVYTALLIFYAGIFVFNGTYNYIDAKDSALAEKLRTCISTGLNYVLYSVLTYSFLCSWKQSRNFLPSS